MKLGKGQLEMIELADAANRLTDAAKGMDATAAEALRLYREIKRVRRALGLPEYTVHSPYVPGREGGRLTPLPTADNPYALWPRPGRTEYALGP